MDTMRDLTPESIAALSDEEVVRVCDAWQASQSLDYNTGRDALLDGQGEEETWALELVTLRRAAHARYAAWKGITSSSMSALDSAVRWAYSAQAHPELLSEAEFAALTAGWGALRS